MNKRTIHTLTHFLNFIKAGVLDGTFNIDDDPEVIISIFNRNHMIARLIESMVIEDYKETKEAIDDRRKLWSSLVIEATKRDWCKTPQDAINYANEIVEATLEQ